MPQNPQNKRSQTTLKHYNKFISVRTEAPGWLKTTIYTGKKPKFEKQSIKEINNYWTSLPVMYLRLNSNTLQIRKSTLNP